MRFTHSDLRVLLPATTRDQSSDVADLPRYNDGQGASRLRTAPQRTKPVASNNTDNDTKSGGIVRNQMQVRRRVILLLFVCLGISAFAVGTHGLHQYLVNNNGDAGWTNVLVGVIGMFLGGSYFNSGQLPGSLAFAQVAAPFVTAFATFELFRSRIERAFRKRRCRHRADHVVLIGLGQSNRLIAEQLVKSCETCVVAVDHGAQSTSKELFNRPRWALIADDATKADVLLAAGAPNASMIHIATGQDGVDVEIAELLRGLVDLRHRNHPLEVKVQIDSPTLARRLQQSEIQRSSSDRIRIEFVNLNALTAATVLEFVANELTNLSSISPEVPAAEHLRIIGETPLVRELQLLCMRSHRARRILGLPTISSHAPSWSSQVSSLDNVPSELSLEGGAISIVQHSEAWRTVDEAARLADRNPLDIVFALCPSGSRPVRSPGFSDAGRIVFVDPDYLVQTPDILEFGPIELMARLIHLDYLQTSSDIPPGDSRPAHQAWSELPSTYRRANRAQVRDFGNKLQVIGCELSDVRDDQVQLTDDEVEILAALEHERWTSERVQDGWTFGVHRDDRAKTHPDLLPYVELSAVAKEKDRRAIRRLSGLAALIGFVIVRRF